MSRAGYLRNRDKGSTQVQQTLNSEIRLVGTGLHSGRPARLGILPGSVDHGIWFKRTDVKDRGQKIAAIFDNVTDTRLNTRIENADGVDVSTIEHLMAALAGCGIHNAMIEIDGPEVPIFDGSSRVFVRAIMDAGRRMQNAPVQVLKILKPIRVERGNAFAELRPHNGFEMDFSIEFSDEAIGKQSFRSDLSNGTFLRELSDCRTFCRQSDVAMMREAGLALGGTLENAVVVDGSEILSPGGFRRVDECVRHKMLDALGDLALAGAPLLGSYRSEKGGHALTNLLLRQLFATKNSFCRLQADDQTAARLPGMLLTASDFAAVV